jgi:hypothetical protein
MKSHQISRLGPMPLGYNTGWCLGEYVIKKQCFSASEGAWKEEVLDSTKLSDFAFKLVDENVLVQEKCLSYSPEDWSKARFESRSRSEFSTTWCEQILGEEILNLTLNMSGVMDYSLFMDLGCGDGRYVKALLK